MNQATLVSSVVEEVLRKMGTLSGSGGHGGGVGGGRSTFGNNGLFDDVDQAVDVATHTHHELLGAGLDVRDGICKMLKKISGDNAQEWGRVELEETKLGRLDHKIAKLELLANVPGVEFLRAHATRAHSGDEGVGFDESAAWGVIGVITPVTHSIPTMTANAINMIAAGNTMIVNAHPSGAKCLAMAAATYNQAIREKYGIGPLICVINPPTLKSAEQIFAHKRIPLLVATGGPAVARAALKQTKRAIVAGPGNPPVVVDETADLDRAAASIVAGASFDNNLLCIGEKEVFVVASVFDKLVAALKRHGGVELNAGQIESLTQAAFTYDKDHYAVQKELVGKDCHVLAAAAGTSCSRETPILFGETDESNPFVPEEQMMPFVPLVRVANFDVALDLAIKYEHGFGHTAIIHSNNLSNITEMGRAVNTTIFVVNGACTAGLGVGGEGYPSYSIATPTGEGITNPMTFTRFRRMGISGSLRMV